VPGIDSGHTAWIIVASAFVLLMTPGLALFYGGMTRSKSVLNMMMMCFGAIGVVSILWVLFGHSISFGGNDVGGLFGDLSQAGMRDILASDQGQAGLLGFESQEALDAAIAAEEVAINGGAATLADGSVVALEAGGIPDLVFSVFQLMFAIITVALIAGAIADRVKYGAWLLFAGLWVTLVYFPVAHWVWGGGWLGELDLIDFAGGTVVHVNAGAAALALVLVVGKRVGWPKEKMRPHNLPMVLLGAALLWFGWFGFNAGSELAVDGVTGIAFANTQIATAAALLGWIIVEWIRYGKPTTLGAASGAVAGLVAITPSCAVLEPMGAIALGLIAGAVCSLFVSLKYKAGYDDSLDVVAVHLVGGAIGALLIGFLATGLVGSDVDGILYGGGPGQLGRQLIGIAAVGAYSFVVAGILGFAIQKTIGFRATPEAETEGIDMHEHAETGYDFSASGPAVIGTGNSSTPAPVQSASTPSASEKVAS
jgi:Amt family ammonium transporter